MNHMFSNLKGAWFLDKFFHLNEILMGYLTPFRSGKGGLIGTDDQTHTSNPMMPNFVIFRFYL